MGQGFRPPEFTDFLTMFGIQSGIFDDFRPLFEGISFQNTSPAIFDVLTTYIRQPPWTLPIVGDPSQQLPTKILPTADMDNCRIQHPHLVDTPDPVPGCRLSQRGNHDIHGQQHHQTTGNAASNPMCQQKEESNVTKEMRWGPNAMFFQFGWLYPPVFTN